MNDAATSLDRLHDIVEPPPVPWWPLAPGWYLVLALVAVALTWFCLRFWKQWQANAYRREALRELRAAKSSAEIAELLRRTALATAPRSKIATLSGDSWAEWLASCVPESMPRAVHLLLAGGVYDPTTPTTDIALFREYANTWIVRHRLPQTAQR